MKKVYVNHHPQPAPENQVKRDIILPALLIILSLIFTKDMLGGCYVTLPTLSASEGCIVASSAPSVSYGSVEFLWAKHEGNYIFAVTSWSTNTDLSYCPTESGYYRMCARKVGCSTMYESSDVYVEVCNLSIAPYMLVEGGTWTQTDEITVYEGKDVHLGMQNVGYNNISLTAPDGSIDNSPNGSTYFSFYDVTAADAGTYTITYSNGSGCSVSEDLILNVIEYAKVGDFVFYDENANGIQDTDEEGLPNVTVKLFKVSDSEPINTKTTSDTGHYLFDQVEPNQSYYVVFSNLPVGYHFSEALKGSSVDIDSDADVNTGATGVFTPAPGANLLDIDAGAYDPSTFPVEWVSFETKQEGGKAAILWATAVELNASHFEIERSIDQVVFEKLGKVQAAGNSNSIQNYTFSDEQITRLGTNKIYYRLKQVDIDGSFSYSDIVELTLTTADWFSLSVYPNPVMTDLAVDWMSFENVYSLLVSDGAGRIVFEHKLNHGKTEGKWKIPVQNWAKGIYFLQVATEYSVQTQRFIVK